MQSFKEYTIESISEGWSLDQMDATARDMASMFRDPIDLGMAEDGVMEDRQVVFVHETDMRVIHNALVGTGWEFVEDIDPETGKTISGFIKGQVDLLVKPGTIEAGFAGTISGHLIGIYCDREAGVTYGISGDGIPAGEYAPDEEVPGVE